MTWLLLVLVAGTVLRFTRLVNKDKLTEPLRAWVRARAIRADIAADERREAAGWRRTPITGTLYWPSDERHFDPPRLGNLVQRTWRGFWPWLDDLIGCPWCVAAWCSIPVAYVALFFPTNRLILGGLLACSASWVAGFVTARTESGEA